MKNLILFVICMLLFMSCSAYQDAMNADNNIRKVELGMNKNDVVQIMGKSYHRMGASTSPEGISIETLGYPTVDAIYMLYFENNRLIEFHKDLVLPTDRVLREN